MSAGLPAFVLATASLVCLVAVHPSLVSGSPSSCLLSRLDFLPCKFHFSTARPGANEVGIYRTKIRTTAPQCCRVKKKPEHVRIESILDLGGVLVLHTPGFKADPQESYRNKMLVEYNLQCAEGDAIYFELLSLDVEHSNCYNNNSDSMVCRDYLHFDLGSYGVDECCGSDYSDNFYLLPSNQLKLWFRSSEETNFAGFQGYAVCLTPSTSKRASCSETTTILPTPATRGSIKPPFTPVPDQPSERPSPSTYEPPPSSTIEPPSRETIEPLSPVTHEMPSPEIHEVPALRPPLASISSLYHARRLVYNIPVLNLTEVDEVTTEAYYTDEAEFIAPTEFSRGREQISLSDKKLLKPTFTAEDREVLNALVESLIALGSDKDSHSIEVPGLQRSAVRLALGNTNSCNRIVQAVSRSYISVTSRANPEVFREIAAHLREEDL